MSSITALASSVDPRFKGLGFLDTAEDIAALHNEVVNRMAQVTVMLAEKAKSTSEPEDTHAETS